MFSKLIPVLFLSLALSSSVVQGLPNPQGRDQSQKSSVRLLALLTGVLPSHPHIIRFLTPMRPSRVQLN